MELYFDKPANSFLEALPIGNGRIGAMVYGELMREQIVLNESSMWSGSKEEANREDAKLYLDPIRKLLAEEKPYEAEQLFREHFTCKGKGSNYAHGAVVPFGCYQILGQLHISHFQAVSAGRISCDCVEDYSRILDLEHGKAEVTFSAFGVPFKRTYFASKEEDAVLVWLRAGAPGNIHFSVGMERDERFFTEKCSENQICMFGQLDDGYGGSAGIHYACAVTVKTVGGEVCTEGTRLYVKGADEAVLIITAETDMSGFMGKKPAEYIKKWVSSRGNAIAEKNCRDILISHENHMADQFKRMRLVLDSEETVKKLPIPERIQRFLQGEEDVELLALYVAYARYLLISSSTKDGFPANLQGIWADEIQTPWNGDWHLNAQQMIYWLAEKANLSENHLPYLKLTEQMMIPGRETAKAYYGARGWLVHTCTNPWGFTAPLEDAAWGSTIGSPAWQCHHLWEHYLYTLDKEYLEWAYPIMKDAALFYVDMLIEDPETGWFVTSPSSSPENSYLDSEGRKCSLCQGPAYDRALIYSLFTYCVQAQYVLKNDPVFIAELKKMIPKLAPLEIGKDGRIMEWGKEYKEAMQYHRHLSHLWGVYPGQLAVTNKDSDLIEAAKKSLDKRGRTTPGWGIAHRMCLNARLGRTEESYRFIMDMLRFATAPNLMNLAYHCDENDQNPETPDLKNVRYPFQIDGNQGNAAGILMMLEDDFCWIQEDGYAITEIYLLNALPKQLPKGKVMGLCAKGGFELDFSWENGQLCHCTVRGKKGTRLTLHLPERDYDLVMNDTVWEIKNDTQVN